MIRKIIGTAGTRIFNAFITFALVIINANILGKEGTGIIGLVLLAITLILLVTNFVGGGALVYLIPKHDNFSLFVLSFIWAILMSVITAFTLQAFSVIPDGFFVDVLILSSIYSIATVNMNILLGKEKIKEFNILQIIQFVSLAISVFVSFFILKKQSVDSYIYSLYISYILCFVFSFIFVTPHIKVKKITNVFKLWITAIKYGTFIQLANITQMLNYRFSYFLLERFMGVGAVGIYNVGTQFSESIWHIGKSVSMVQYTRISNSKNENYNKKLSLSLLKFVALITFLLVVILNVLPERFFLWILSNDFEGIKLAINSLSPGIFFIACSMIFSHYFSGTGKHFHNTISSSIGLVLTIALGFYLIPKYGIVGAGVTASISYFASTLYQFIVFVKITNSKFKDFILRKNDYQLLKEDK